MFARLHKHVLTIGGLAHAAVLASVLIALLITAGLISTSTRLESTTATMFSSAQSFALAREAQIALLMYQRISNLYVLTGDPALEGARTELLDDLRRALADAGNDVPSGGERAILEEISALLELYLRQRAELETERAPIEEVLQLTQPSVDQIVDALDTLHDINQAQI